MSTQTNTGFKFVSVNEKNSELERKVDMLENNLRTGIEQGNNLERKLKDTITMHDNLEQYSRKFNLEIYGNPSRKAKMQRELCWTLLNAYTLT